MSDELNKIKALLKDVGEKVDKANEIARLKGENFNIFKILGVETKENKTHSNFLVELLNPDGSHGMGDAFLNLFYDELKSVVSVKDEDKVKDEDENKSNILEALRGDKVNVRVEEVLGKVNLEDATGGRVDITLRSLKGKGNIFIENKIYAGDQSKQIARYCDNHVNEKTIVMYLTLYGSQPSDDSRGKNKEGKDFFLLSYQTNIINWLEKCQKEASDFPIIRETIKQYIILIKKLTGQLISQEMEKEIIKLLSEKNNLSAMLTIVNSVNAVKNHTINHKFLPELKSICIKFGLEIDYKEIDWTNTKWAGFSIYNPSWSHFKISFEFQTKGMKSGIIGFTHKNREKINSETFIELKKRMDSDSANIMWSYKRLSEYANWDNRAFLAISDGRMSSVFKNEIEHLLEYSKGLEM